MKPLRDLLLIELEDSVKEEVRPSGIILLSTSNNLYQIGDEESVLQDLIKRPKMNKGKVIATGERCTYFSTGNTVIYKKGTEATIIENGGNQCALVKQDNVLVVFNGNEYLPHPDYILVKITKEAREALYNKKIKRDDGTEVLLFISADKGVDDEDSSKYFVSSGEIVKAGVNVKYVKEGDLALISYLCDNDNTIIVGYDGDDKIIAVRAITTRHSTDNVFYGHGKVRDQIVWQKGEYEELASVYGVVSGEMLIPIEPYVFLEHEETKVMKIGGGGIIYEEDEKIIKRQVLATSQESNYHYGVCQGDTVVVDDFDVFTIEFNGNKISAINDCDIMYK